MIIRGTNLDGVHVIDLERREDERGFFARIWCRAEFEAAGLDPNVAQANLSFNRRRGTVRGMHYQVVPHEEVKLIRCVRGAMYDVAVDVRPDSPTYASWVGTELSAENRSALYVPRGFAHGFQTLEDDTEFIYLVSAAYVPSAQRGVRWDDPRAAIDWPLPVSVVSEMDRRWPDLEPRVTVSKHDSKAGGPR